jgi:mRNA-degrading endonuclease RelE of RelBE toxin-antitoxin system
MTEVEFNINDSLIEKWLTQESKKSQMVDEKAKAIILHTLEIFEYVGPIAAREKLPRTRTKHLFDNIWEIRVCQYRIAYFWDDAVCVLLHGIRKKTDEWPLKEIKVVKTRKEKYFKNK